ncbi:alpha/beta hydrolase [Oceanobacillus jeddahense]|uniref:Alpha/beta fold hydrolase n=1 Tax=Oceanobacillus jeddahense TaxID=1462527 RepID=A0ABY5JPU3_9BACI|nr:alpha/beta fold hydrolase [Oceanobacillus jeddahense]UUI02316.1 alpha/beta fold hydrolase [Oceanobacillus jeddahense]
MRKKYILMISLVIFLLSACSSQESTAEENAEAVLQQLQDEEYQQITEQYFSEALLEKYPADELQLSWEANRGSTFEEISNLEAAADEEETTVSGEIIFDDATMEVQMDWNEEEKLESLQINRPFEELALPDTVVEEDITLEAEEGYPLQGKLTLPAEGEGPYPAVVLVQGSGGSDMNEAIFKYRPFQDIAYGLAEEGIAVLRYDKRTYTHGEKMAEELGPAITVKEETIDDAVEAAGLLQDDERIRTDQVYIGGNSLGGIVAPRIDEEADTAGMIILAGSPRPLWEILYDQQINLLPESLRDQAEEFRDLAESFQDMAPEEAMEYDLGGMSGYYFHEMDQYDVGQIALDSNKPLLILQGEADFQVTLENDFAAWQDIFENEPQATLKSYPNLNHLFILSQGENKGTVEEYNIPGHVEEQVIKDMSDWIHEQAE